MEFINNCDFINQIFFTKLFSQRLQEYSFLVHSAIYPMVQKFLTWSGVTDLQHLGSYELTVGANKFDMEILFLETQNASSFVSLFKNILQISQFTYFWDDGITLFREVNRYYELEEFIAINKLKKHVVSVDDFSGVNSLGQPIKLVTFDGTSDKIHRVELFQNYEEFLQTKSSNTTAYDPIYHFYFTNVLPWHSSEMFRMYSSPFQNQRIFLVLQTFLTCMRELTYTREPHLDLISLCSLKLAFCDELNLTEASRDLQFEIDALIERFLHRMVQKQTYIQNGEFDLNRYAVDTNCSVQYAYLAVHNLIYTFQHVFHSTNLNANGFLENVMFADFHFRQTFMLNDESTDLNMLRDTSNITYKVDGQNYNKMNSKLFCELLKLRNVVELELDTNYKWTNEPHLIDFVNYGDKYVTLVGTNEFNFIEDFIQFLKTMPTILTSAMVLNIEEVTLKSYNIFKNLKVFNLQFHGSKITFTMLTELLACDLKNDLIISLYECTIEDKTCTWSLLIKGFDRDNVTVEILEEEKTWEYLFESIANHLNNFKLHEFNFKCDLGITCMNDDAVGTVWVRLFKFRFDEFDTRLELQNESGRAIDLYDWKNTVDKFKDDSEDDYENFEFYE